MKTELLYSTPEYQRLVELAISRCHDIIIFTNILTFINISNYGIDTLQDAISLLSAFRKVGIPV